MWNRVILLLSGVAFGWSLVHYASAPQEDLPALRVGLMLSGGIGIALAIVIGLGNPMAGLLALFVLAASALVAYAANAKQVNRPPAPPLLHGVITPRAEEERTGILLVIGGEPARYEGPAFWAWWLKTGPSAKRPHWFLTPWRFGHIRRAYYAMGGASPVESAVGRLIERLEKVLGEGYVVRPARLFASPPVRDALAQLAEEGFKRTLIVPIGQAFAYQPILNEQIALSRARETGMRITATPPIAAEGWLGMPAAQRLDALLEGTMPPSPGEEEPLALEIAQAVQRAEKDAWTQPHSVETSYG